MGRGVTFYHPVGDGSYRELLGYPRHMLVSYQFVPGPLFCQSTTSDRGESCPGCGSAGGVSSSQAPGALDTSPSDLPRTTPAPGSASEHAMSVYPRWVI